MAALHDTPLTLAGHVPDNAWPHYRQEELSVANFEALEKQVHKNTDRHRKGIQVTFDGFRRFVVGIDKFELDRDAPVSKVSRAAA